MAGGDWSYQEMIENCAQYNHSITLDRRSRLPFLDAQTGIAQVPCHLWRMKSERLPVTDASVGYKYPSRRWRKKKPSYASQLLGADGAGTASTEPPSGGTGAGQDADASRTADSADATYRATVTGGKITTEVPVQEQYWYDDYGDITADDFEDPSDTDDYEEQTKRKRKKKTASKTSKKAANMSADSAADRPYSCPHCSMRYKTKPGLHYHMRHHHTDTARSDLNVSVDQSVLSGSTNASSRTQLATSSSPAVATMTGCPSTSAMVDSQRSLYGSARLQQQQHQQQPVRSFIRRSVDVSAICDLCLGDMSENKKTNKPEQLISCNDCGRSGHPSCLQFTPNMVISTRKYGWQCIECKSCVLCGTSENDEQLLFCDDCDRGFHMYCLTPKLYAPPEGTWSCQQCQEVFAYQRYASAATAAFPMRQAVTQWSSSSSGGNM